MGKLQLLTGAVRIELISADIPTLLNRLNQEDISLEDIAVIDEISFRATVQRLHINRIIAITQDRGDKLTVLWEKSINRFFRRLSIRPVLLIGVSILLFLAVFLPTRIIFVRVEGNSVVPTKQIMEMADVCGISLFASRRHVRSEKVKNALLDKLPQLQWVGVNTSGCVATIRVTEKTTKQQQSEVTGGVSNIIAVRDGIILDFTATQGEVLCQIGQAVRAGETLVSGYKNCGIAIKATRAKGEVYAKTLHDLQIVTPLTKLNRGEIIRQETKYSILFGKKLIKLHKDSGISDTSCVRIYDEYVWSLPGGFSLPISLIKETYVTYAPVQEPQTDDCEWLADAAAQYLQTQMIAGQIISQNVNLEMLDDVYYLNGTYSCVEMIGQEKKEELLQR